jgi:hypothetical protein
MSFNMRLSLVVLLSSVAAFGQTGSIIGTIRTAAGAGVPVSKAPVRAKNTASGASYSAQSAADGSFNVTDLGAGDYDVSIEYSPFFLPFRQHRVQVAAGKATRLDAKLEDVTFGTLGDGGVEFAWLLADHPAPTGPAPRTPEGKPDLSGVWLPSFPEIGKFEPLPWAAELIKKRGDGTFTDNPTALCLPMGIPGSGLFDEERIIQTSREIAILNGGINPAREIYLDGRKHPSEEKMFPSWMGHSVGGWEGDTLVVDTVGFNDRGWVLIFGQPQTEKLHITERYRRPDLGHLEVEVIIDDPGAYKQPWTIKRVNTLAPADEELLEYVCAENNRDVKHMVGK